LAVYSSEAGPYAAVAQTEVHSADHGSLTAIAREFLTEGKVSVDRACFAVAGPVMDGRAKISNLPWVIDESTVATELKLEFVHLINDLDAITFAVLSPGPDDIRPINVGVPVPMGTIGVIGPGTGLGESFLTWRAPVK
jgi:glucokinase